MKLNLNSIKNQCIQKITLRGNPSATVCILLSSKDILLYGQPKWLETVSRFLFNQINIIYSQDVRLNEAFSN